MPSALTPGVAGVVARRLDLPCAVAGFEPPVCRVHLKVLHMGPRWSLLMRTVPGRAPAVAEWANTHRPASVTIAPGIAPTFLRADFRELPAHWRWMTFARVHHIDLTPDGMASIFVQGTVQEVERLLDWTRQSPHPVHERPTRSGPGGPEMTPRQFEALSTAVALGYYEIPHRIDLRALAQKIGISVGSVSALLRRAEAAVITNYVDSRSQARWDPVDPTLPDGVPEVPMPAPAERSLEAAQAEPENLTRRPPGTHPSSFARVTR